MKKSTPLLALIAAAAFLLNGCIVINVEKKDSPDQGQSGAKATKEITVESP